MFFCKGIREVLIAQVTFMQRSEGTQMKSHVDIGRDCISGRRKSNAKALRRDCTWIARQEGW